MRCWSFQFVITLFIVNLCYQHCQYCSSWRTSAFSSFQIGIGSHSWSKWQQMNERTVFSHKSYMSCDCQLMVCVKLKPAEQIYVCAWLTIHIEVFGKGFTIRGSHRNAYLGGSPTHSSHQPGLCQCRRGTFLFVLFCLQQFDMSSLFCLYIAEPIEKVKTHIQLSAYSSSSRSKATQGN